MEGHRTGGYQIALTLVLGFAFGIVFFDRNALNFLMPFVVREIPLSNAQIGMIASSLALSWAASGLVISRLADRIGHRKMLLLMAVIVFSLSSFITGLARSFAFLFAARLLMGVAEGPVLPLSQSLIASGTRPGRRGLSMGLMQNVFSNLLGSLFAPLILVSVADNEGWRTAFYLTAAPGLVASVMILFVVRDTAPVAHEALHVRGSLAQALASRNVLICAAISALMVGWMITGWVFLPIYFTGPRGFTTHQMSMLMSVLGLTGACAGFLVPMISDRIGRRPVLFGFCLIGVLTPIAAMSSLKPAMLLTLVIAVGWMAAGTFSLFMATVPSESAPRGLVTTAMALCMGSGELFGGGVTPAFVGVLADHFGPTMPMLAEMGLASLAAFLALSLQETHPGNLRKLTVLNNGDDFRSRARQL